MKKDGAKLFEVLGPCNKLYAVTKGPGIDLRVDPAASWVPPDLGLPLLPKAPPAAAIEVVNLIADPARNWVPPGDLPLLPKAPPAMPPGYVNPQDR